MRKRCLSNSLVEIMAAQKGATAPWEQRLEFCRKCMDQAIKDWCEVIVSDPPCCLGHLESHLSDEEKARPTIVFLFCQQGSILTQSMCGVASHPKERLYSRFCSRTLRGIEHL